MVKKRVLDPIPVLDENILLQALRDEGIKEVSTGWLKHQYWFGPKAVSQEDFTEITERQPIWSSNHVSSTTVQYYTVLYFLCSVVTCLC